MTYRRQIVFLLTLLLLIGGLLAGCGDSETAQQHVERSLSLNQEGNYNQALEEANKAIELDPELAEAYNSRAWAYGQRRQWDKTIADATKAIQLDEESARILSTVSMEQRLEIWSRAQYAIADFPFTGPGLDAFQYVMPILYPLFQTPIDRLVPHAHNEFLQVALDLGLPGLVAWLALYVVTLWMLWRTYRRTTDDLIRALALGCTGVLTAHLVYATTDCAVLDAKPNIVFWAIVGLGVALHHAVERAGAGRRNCAEGHFARRGRHG